MVKFCTSTRTLISRFPSGASITTQSISQNQRSLILSVSAKKTGETSILIHTFPSAWDLVIALVGKIHSLLENLLIFLASFTGSRFALMELKTIFYYLLLNFSFDVTEKSTIPFQYEKVPFAMKPLNGVWVGLKPRVQ